MSDDRRPEAQALDQLVDTMHDAGLIDREIQRLRRIERWAISQLPVQEGDAVVLVDRIDAPGGWAPYREVLVPGRTGVLHSFYLYPEKNAWAALFTPDDIWVVTAHDPRRRLKTEPKSFMIALEHFRKRTPEDEPLPVPELKEAGEP